MELISETKENHQKQARCSQDSPFYLLTSLFTRGFHFLMILVESVHFIGSVSIVDGCPLCVSVQIPDSESGPWPVDGVNCVIRESVADTVMNKTGKVPGLLELTISWLSLLRGHSPLKAARLWEGQLPRMGCRQSNQRNRSLIYFASSFFS